MSWGLPSFSDVRNAAANAAGSVTKTVTATATQVRDLGSAAIERTRALASDGVDLGRRAVNAVRSTDVREAAAVVRTKIGEGTEAARDGIKTGVEWAGQRTGELADVTRAHVPGGDNIVSNAVRGAITQGENATRFQLGVVGGVTREVVGLAGTVGELGTTLAEMQISPAARGEYGRAMLDGAAEAADATGHYLTSATQDPARIGRDLTGAARGVGDWAGGQLDRYEQAFHEDNGFETVGMDVGTVATYLVPVGGGPARGAVTAAARSGSELAARGATEATVRAGTEASAREVGEVAARNAGEIATDTARGAAGAGRTLEQMSATLRQVTGTELNRLRTVENLGNKTIGPAISTVMDSRTGAISRTYINAPTAAVPENLNAVLAGRMGAAERIDYVATRGAGTHSEVYAVNELLNKGSRLEDLVVYTEQVGTQRAGGVKPPCPHCALLLDGVRYAQ